MKKLMLVCCFVIGAASMSFAQGGQGGQGAGRMRPDPAAQAARLKDALKLSDDQTTKITAIYAAQAAKQDSLVKAANGDFSTLRTAFAPMREATNAKIKAVLTPEQAAAYDKMPPQFGRRGGQGGQGGGQGGQQK